MFIKHVVTLSFAFEIVNISHINIVPTTKTNIIGVIESLLFLLYPLFFFRRKGYINFVSKSVHLSVRPPVTFLVNVSPHKPLEVATSNFIVE